MAIQLTVALTILKKLGPVVGPEAVNQAKKLIGANTLKKTAHDLAYQRGGRVGEVTFLDGAKRWVAVDAGDKPIAAFPPYDDGSPEALAKGLQGVDLDRCMRKPDPELKEEKRREKEQRKADKERLQIEKGD